MREFGGVTLEDERRILSLRTRVLATKDPTALARLRDTAVVDGRSLRASQQEVSWTVRRGMLTRDRLAAMRFEVDELEFLVGRLRPVEAGPDEEEAARAFLGEYELDLPGQTGHCELDLASLMQLGITGLARSIEEAWAAKGDARAGHLHEQEGEAYRSFLLALGGLSAMIEGAAEMVRVESRTAAPERQAELQALAEACSRVACEAPATFLEAVQLLWFVLVGVMHADRAWLVVPGHLDRTLWPFYQADTASGVLTRAEALRLIEQLYLLVNAYIPDGLAMSVMVGGRDAEGRDVTNELSYLCLEALRRTKMIYPTVGVCWHEGTPQALVDLTVELMGQGYPTPAFFGDATIQRGLAALGVPVDEACRYINSTCVEITPSGASNVWVASPYYNTCGLLLDEIAAQAQAPAGSFSDFAGAYQRRLAAAVAEGVAQQNAFRLERQERMRRPLQSVFTRDCVAAGQDIEEGGARYNWVECSFIGLANLADALYVIREEVFQQERLTLAQLKAILDADFEGLEATRQRFLNGYPKYGQGHAEVDGLLGEIIGFVTETCAGFSMAPDGSPYVPGAFAWVMHEQLGRQTGATPDGRRAGFPFADGCGPAQGRETCGPTAAVLSVTGWDHSRMIGGLAYNLKFNSSLFASADGYAGLKALILTYLRRGGFEVQVNVVDAETLKAARQNPEAYRDLIVRIGGYADYFTRLSPEMQDELILRTSFGAF
jgi:trans-4-hydroxy-L-proline dehydratase